MDYRETLNLPKTSFSMRAGLAKKEPEYLKNWADNGLAEAIKAKSKDKTQFVLHDGPPYANGHIHIGHALNKILKDFIVKNKNMEGFSTSYVPGWDCHGLPIEHKLLKERKQRKQDVDAVSFRKDAYQYALDNIDIQRDEFKRLGVFGEWDKPYLTLDPNYEYWILNSLSELTKKGYVYQGSKPVNWCFECETALAEAEVEYEDHVSKSVYVKFAITNADQLPELPAKQTSLLIWTTTPWTLIANVAVSAHGAFTYDVVDLGDEQIILESSLVSKVLAKAKLENAKTVATVTGEQLTKLTYQHPFSDKKDCPVVKADYVTKEDGTGLVHTAPGHGADDFDTGKKYDLEVIMPVNDRGVYKEGPYAGEHVFKANPKIIDNLMERNILLAQDDLNHSYPHCWRCKKPIIFRATNQWFIKIDHDNLRSRAKEIISTQVKWIPESGEERITSMVTGRPDWCISRQRYWGVPIPALKIKSTQEVKLYPEVIDHVAQLVREDGTDVWFERDVKDLIPDGFKDPDTGADDFEKTFDILDVWFDSGVSCQAVVRDMIKADLPADLYLEGSDQHRGWFQSSLIPAVAMEGIAPFKQVLTHGFVVDGQGRKMSKALGNVVAPQEIYKTNGADILRLWVASTSYNEDMRCSKEVLAQIVDAYRKIRNTIRYFLSNLYDFDPDTEMVGYDQLMDLDQWALNRLSEVSVDVRTKFTEYEFSKVYKSIYRFCNEDLSNFYLDILKDRLYVKAAKSAERKAAQTTLYHILNHLVRLLAPIISFTAEEVFLTMPKEKSLADVTSVHLLEFLDPDPQWKNADVSKHFELLIALRPHVLKALEEQRSKGDIGSSLQAQVIFNTASPRDLEYLNGFGEHLAEMFIVSQAQVNQVDEVKEGASETFAQTQIVIEKAQGQKCERSWKYSTTVGHDPDHPTLSAESAQIVRDILSSEK